ncbi:MAG: hypothetical protein RMJ19_01140 [Gemmatales bacterium]|nr:hypothetical protein [Gemmatales bacterium]MCS7159051.1 hypothetical protein [Gemmatales bacterium]MDW8174251.1 hypothetical protein [Gemmatales bacterium]MDW8223029.1 hypothetical protein [Gemmatales bacterium]
MESVEADLAYFHDELADNNSARKSGKQELPGGIGETRAAEDAGETTLEEETSLLPRRR